MAGAKSGPIQALFLELPRPFGKAFAAVGQPLFSGTDHRNRPGLVAAGIAPAAGAVGRTLGAVTRAAVVLRLARLRLLSPIDAVGWRGGGELAAGFGGRNP